MLAPAIELAERGVPMGPMLNSPALRKYPTSARVYAPPDGRSWKEGDVWKNPDLARTLRRLVEAEKQAASQGRQAALKAARDRFYKGDIAREMARFSEENGGLFRYEDFAGYTAKLEEPVAIDYRGYTVYKNASATQGPAELFALKMLEVTTSRRWDSTPPTTSIPRPRPSSSPWPIATPSWATWISSASPTRVCCRTSTPRRAGS